MAKVGMAGRSLVEVEGLEVVEALPFSASWVELAVDSATLASARGALVARRWVELCSFAGKGIYTSEPACMHAFFSYNYLSFL